MIHLLATKAYIKQHAYKLLHVFDIKQTVYKTNSVLFMKITADWLRSVPRQSCVNDVSDSGIYHSTCASFVWN